MRGTLAGPLEPDIEALFGSARDAGKTEAFDAEIADRIAFHMPPARESWRSRYFSDDTARVFIFGDRLRVFVRRAE